jgi:hypothetical protein
MTALYGDPSGLKLDKILGSCFFAVRKFFEFAATSIPCGKGHECLMQHWNSVRGWRGRQKSGKLGNWDPENLKT